MADYSWYKPKKNAGQKFKGFLRKVFFAGAAMGGVTGAGYHHYGTDETFIATVTSVDVSPVKKEGDAPEMTVHTDRGTFVNSPSLLHWKGDKDAVALGRQMKAGARVKFTVYGLHPRVLGLTPDSFGIHRNITRAEIVPAGYVLPKPQPAPAPAPAPESAPALPSAGGFRTVDGVTAETDNRLPKICADLADLEGLRRDAPQLYRDLALLERLPVTGRPVFDKITARDAMLRSCLIPDEGSTTHGSYSSKMVHVVRGTGSTVSMHEYFHAVQDLDGRHIAGMAPVDAAVALALGEATAVGYELMLRREAQNLGIALYRDAAGQAEAPVTFASETAALRLVFDRAYDRAVKAGGDEKAALQAGGVAAVRALMFGDDSDWLHSYAQLVVRNLNNNVKALDFDAAEKAGYAARRTKLFSSQGKLGDDISIIPAEFTGADAEHYVRRVIGVMGINISAPAPKAAPKQAPGV